MFVRGQLFLEDGTPLPLDTPIRLFTLSSDDPGPTGSGGNSILRDDEFVNDDGNFRLRVETGIVGGTCRGLFLYTPPPIDPEYPPLDELSIFVDLAGCTQRINIPVNEQTVIDVTFPNDELVLRDPIVVPPCEVP